MSLDRSHACDKFAHAECDKTVTIMDQDGSNRYVCQCSCHREDAVCACRRSIYRQNYASEWKHTDTHKRECGTARPHTHTDLALEAIIIPGLIGLSATWLWEHRRYRDRITQQRITQQRRADALAALGRTHERVRGEG